MKNKAIKKQVIKINGIKIDVRSDVCLYVTIKDTTFYLENSSVAKQFVDIWEDN